MITSALTVIDSVIGLVSGHDFSHADKTKKLAWALAPEGCCFRLCGHTTGTQKLLLAGMFKWLDTENSQNLSRETVDSDTLGSMRSDEHQYFRPGRVAESASAKRSIESFSRPAIFILLFFLALNLGQSQAQVQGSPSDEYPAKRWKQLAKPEDRGWSTERLAAAKAYADSLDTAAVIVVDDGIIVSQWGATATQFNVHSIRKSFLSALYGIATAKGQIELNATLDQLGIDDNEPSLTPEEKQARVVDLLKARSGIYHAALYETPAMKAEKPARGSHPPRTFWCYNNWDFNALGTIYEKLTHDSIYHAFDAQIAQRIGMEDYDPKEQNYVIGSDSIHRAYPFRMTARDMARFGLLYLKGGRWHDQQLIPAQWVKDSTTAYSIADGNARDSYSGYGYLWWIAANGNHYPHVEVPDGSFSAWGAGGHFIAVIPALNIVVVHRVNTDDPAKKVTLEQFGELLRLILAAKKR